MNNISSTIQHDFFGNIPINTEIINTDALINALNDINCRLKAVEHVSKYAELQEISNKLNEIIRKFSRN